MLGDRLDRDNDLFSLAAHHLGPLLARLREWVLEGQGFAEPSVVRTETFLTWARSVINCRQTNIWGMIDANGHDAPAEAVVLSVEFPNDQEGEAFATRFDGQEPQRLPSFTT